MQEYGFRWRAVHSRVRHGGRGRRGRADARRRSRLSLEGSPGALAHRGRAGAQRALRRRKEQRRRARPAARGSRARSWQARVEVEQMLGEFAVSLPETWPMSASSISPRSMSSMVSAAADVTASYSSRRQQGVRFSIRRLGVHVTRCLEFAPPWNCSRRHRGARRGAEPDPRSRAPAATGTAPSCGRRSSPGAAPSACHAAFRRGENRRYDAFARSCPRASCGESPAVDNAWFHRNAQDAIRMRDEFSAACPTSFGHPHHCHSPPGAACGASPRAPTSPGLARRSTSDFRASSAAWLASRSSSTACLRRPRVSPPASSSSTPSQPILASSRARSWSASIRRRARRGRAHPRRSVARRRRVGSSSPRAGPRTCSC